MRILISNITDKRAIALNNLGEVGNLFTAPRHRTPFLPYYALDNGAYSCFLHHREFDDNSFGEFLRKWYNLNSAKPKWLVVPDVVGDRPQTLKNYIKWKKRLRRYKTPIAFAVQDGMKMSDVLSSAEVVFVGGSTEWKVKIIPYWCDHFPRVHVARVNGWTRSINCYQAGAESVDGTGYFKAGWNDLPMVNLRLFLRWQSGELDISLFHLRNLSTSKRRYMLQQLNGEQFDWKTLPLFGSV